MREIYKLDLNGAVEKKLPNILTAEDIAELLTRNNFGNCTHIASYYARLLDELGVSNHHVIKFVTPARSAFLAKEAVRLKTEDKYAGGANAYRSDPVVNAYCLNDEVVESIEKENARLGREQTHWGDSEPFAGSQFHAANIVNIPPAFEAALKKDDIIHVSDLDALRDSVLIDGWVTPERCTVFTGSEISDKLSCIYSLYGDIRVVIANSTGAFGLFGG